MRTQTTENFQRIKHRRLWASRQWVAVIMTAAAFLLLACGNDATDATASQPGGAQPVSSKADKDLDPAIEFELVLFGNDEHEAGERISLSGLAGDPVVLNFWFPSCPPCVAEMPDFEKLYQKYKGDGLKVVGIQLLGLDTVEDGQTFVKRLNVNYMLGPDQAGDKIGQTVMDYKISGFPTTIFIDRDHNIVRKWTGALNFEKLEELTLNIMN